MKARYRMAHFIHLPQCITFSAMPHFVSRCNSKSENNDHTILGLNAGDNTWPWRRTRTDCFFPQTSFSTRHEWWSHQPCSCEYQLTSRYWWRWRFHISKRLNPIVRSYASGSGELKTWNNRRGSGKYHNRNICRGFMSSNLLRTLWL